MEEAWGILFFWGANAYTVVAVSDNDEAQATRRENVVAGTTRTQTNVKRETRKDQGTRSTAR